MSVSSQDVENIVALPNEAAEAEEMLKDETQLLQVDPVVTCTLTPPYETLLGKLTPRFFWHLRVVHCQPTSRFTIPQPEACAGRHGLLPIACKAVGAGEQHALQAYETLAILEGTSSLAQQALLAGGLTGGQKLKQQDTHNLSAYFNKVPRLWGRAACVTGLPAARPCSGCRLADSSGRLEHAAGSSAEPL